jgi:uncharacterized protein (DUF885 family)
MIGRRNLIGAAVAVATVPRIVRASPVASFAVTAILDAAASARTANERYRLLLGIDTTALAEAVRIDVEGARAGASIEAAIAREFPFADEMGAPFAVSPSAGSWRGLAKSAEASSAPVEQIDEETGRVRNASAAGFALPTSVFPGFLKTFDAAVAHVADGATVAALGRQREALIAAATAAPPGDGLGRSRRGRALYARLLHLQAGEEVDPATLHAVMGRLCATLGDRADQLLRGQGLNRGSVAERLRAFARDPRFLYKDDDSGRERAVADMNRWLDGARAVLPQAFDVIPSSASTVRAHRMSVGDEVAGRAGYRILPDTAKGVEGGYFVDLSHIQQRPSWSLRSVVHHELLPGHMMQLPLQQAVHPHPLRLRYAPGFVEGWAIYAEQLAAEEGLFIDDPAGEIGYLQWMLFRAGRAWVDCGIHLRGWSIAQAVQKLTDLQGDQVIFAPFIKDATRAALDPAGLAGQAWNWRVFASMASAAGPIGSGARRRFHDAALCHGALPIATLKAVLSPRIRNKP